MTKADVRSFMEGVLASIQSLILAVVVLVGVLVLLAMVIPMPDSGLAFELTTLLLGTLPAYGWMFLKFTNAARRSTRTYMGFSAGVAATDIIAEILLRCGLMPMLPGEPIATVIPEWLVVVWAYVLFVAIAYAGYQVGKIKRETAIETPPPAPPLGPYGAPRLDP